MEWIVEVFSSVKWTRYSRWTADDAGEGSQSRRSISIDWKNEARRSSRLSSAETLCGMKNKMRHKLKVGTGKMKGK